MQFQIHFNIFQASQRTCRLARTWRLWTCLVLEACEDIHLRSLQEPACSRALSPASLRLRHEEYTWIYKNIRPYIQSNLCVAGVASKIQTISCSITISSQVDLQRTLWLCSSGDMGLTVWHCLILLALCQLEKQTNGCVLLRSTIFQQLCKGCVLMTGGHLAQEGPPPSYWSCSCNFIRTIGVPYHL